MLKVRSGRGAQAGRDSWGFTESLVVSTVVCFGLKLMAIVAEQGLGYFLGKTRYGPAIRRMVGVDPPNDAMVRPPTADRWLLVAFRPSRRSVCTSTGCRQQLRRHQRPRWRCRRGR